MLAADRTADILMRVDTLTKAGWMASQCVGAVMFANAISHREAEDLELRRAYKVLGRWALWRRSQGRAFSISELAGAHLRYWERRIEQFTETLRKQLAGQEAAPEIAKDGPPMGVAAG